MPKLSMRLEPRDLWVGLFWDRKRDGLQIVVCPIPVLAITLFIPKRPRLDPCEICGEERGHEHCAEWLG